MLRTSLDGEARGDNSRVPRDVAAGYESPLLRRLPVAPRHQDGVHAEGLAEDGVEVGKSSEGLEVRDVHVPELLVDSLCVLRLLSELGEEADERSGRRFAMARSTWLIP